MKGLEWQCSVTWRRQWQPTPVLLPGKSHGRRSLVGCSPWGLKESDTTERLYFHFHALEKEMTTHSSVLAWRIPGTGESGGLPSMGLRRVRHDWSDLAAEASSVTGQWQSCICWVEMGVWMAWRANRSCFSRVSIISNSGKVEWVQILGTQYGDKTLSGQQDYK